MEHPILSVPQQNIQHNGNGQNSGDRSNNPQLLLIFHAQQRCLSHVACSGLVLYLATSRVFWVLRRVQTDTVNAEVRRREEVSEVRTTVRTARLSAEMPVVDADPTGERLAEGRPASVRVVDVVCAEQRVSAASTGEVLRGRGRQRHVPRQAPAAQQAQSAHEQT